MFCRREEALLDIREEADLRDCRRTQIDPGGGSARGNGAGRPEDRGSERKVRVIGDATNMS